MEIVLDTLMLGSGLIVAAMFLVAIGYAIKWYINGFANYWEKDRTLMYIYLVITALAVINGIVATSPDYTNTAAAFFFIFSVISGFFSFKMMLDGIPD
ncbi:MAG: hypothetical protein A2418_03325 [Candidatus Brennerbacteria bacterium RIFOXYC1_FULL_41_11]|uniref:Uncharacterized protein n=1 Tax=Candidatus Brennerbacteria bacterium RIFOXYD1_FULL_41_16 TaxID=1797529 RepID=A0A1G1XM40_9BACT|nr:MAG: hypothetical protein A2391_01005 [Candidatus Brennerbacteria bacterium RIFOXYB1_FULL_41_13]OGY40107.1 MAG: hypothetical protein A2418_03325 [Candidatus Brennerbacteria bacterium RIFOXYC1_FULL_41_11]OGY40670.1 MAG: hypothetical protein A2570_00870 [Candidatus Brennerbacteria bacterium RIFOXYD1_FULL_41_16]